MKSNSNKNKAIDDPNDIPENCKIILQLADNTLEDELFTKVKLTIENGRVSKAEMENNGAYSWDLCPSLGWSRSRIYDWLQFDSTGEHPKEIHEILDIL